MNTSKQALIFAAIAILSWSTVATAFKVALGYQSHFEMLVFASATALIILAVVMTAQKKWSILSTLTKKQWLKYALTGLLNPVAYYLVLFKAYALLPAQVAQPINYSWPIVLVVLLAIMSRKAIPVVKYVGMALSLGGVALISLGSGSLNGSSLPLSGLLLAFLSAFLWALYWIINNANKNVDNTVNLLLSFLFGSLYLIIASLFVGINVNSWQGILSSMYVGAFEMAIPFIFFGLALRKSDNPVLINQLCYLSPFISLFFISVVLGEKIYATTYIGLLLIVSGIIFNEYFTHFFVKRKLEKRALDEKI